MTWLRLRDLYLDKLAPRKAADIEIEILRQEIDDA